MKPSRPAAARWAATLLLASAGSLAHAHGNIRLPWWTGLAVGLYLTLPLPLLVAAIGAVRDRKAPRWQRIGVPLSLALGALLFYVTLLKGHIPEKLIPLADHDAVAAVVCFLPLALPAGFAMVWLAGFISRARRKK